MRQGHPRASLQISASPALSAGSGVALPGEKTLQLELPPSPPDKMPPWDGERQLGSCQQPSRAVRRNRAPDELKPLPFKEWQRLRHPGTNHHSFCRLPTAACTRGPHWPCPMVPTAAQSRDGQPGQQSPGYRLSLENPRALDGRAGFLLRRSPTQGPHGPIDHLRPPQQTSRTSSFLGAGGGEDDAFSQSLHQATANTSHQRPKHFAPLTQKVLLVQQRICCCHPLC